MFCEGGEGGAGVPEGNSVMDQRRERLCECLSLQHSQKRLPLWRRGRTRSDVAGVVYMNDRERRRGGVVLEEKQRGGGGGGCVCRVVRRVGGCGCSLPVNSKLIRV